MAVNILTSNSGTTFLRTGGINKIKIKSNLAWTFKLLPLNDDNDIEAVKILTAMTEDEEIISTLTGTGTTVENISWINIINDLHDGVKEITGQGTTYLDIRADENYTGKDLFAVGYAEAITEPNICDYTVFEQYGKNYYFMLFDYDEEVSGQTIHTPGSSSSAVTEETINLGIESSATEIPVEMYTNTKCKVTIHGISGINSDTGEEFVIGPGVTKTGYPDEEFVFKFRIPENKTSENIVYTLRATSEDDPRYTEEWYVVQKGITPKIILTPPSQNIGYNITAFTVNYQICPLTLSVDLGIFKDGVLIETRTVSTSSLVSDDGYYRGAITYECGRNPNKGNGNTVYSVSGETIGETFQTQSNVAIINHSYENYYFYLEYNGTTGTSINVPGDGQQLDGDSDTSYVVTVHTNQGYGGYSLSYNGECITDCQKYSGEEDVFYVKFNVHSNEDGSVKNGTITVSGPGGPGIINVTQAGGTQPPPPVDTFEWLSGIDSASGVEAWKTIGGVAGTTYSFGYSYTQQLYPRLSGNYNGVSVTNSNYGFTLSVDESYTGERDFTVYLAKTQTGFIDAVADLHVTQRDSVSYTFSGTLHLTWTSTRPSSEIGIVHLTAITVKNQDLGSVVSMYEHQGIAQIPTDGNYEAVQFSSDISYGAWTSQRFTLELSYRINNSQTDIDISNAGEINVSVPSGTGTVDVPLSFDYYTIDIR